MHALENKENCMLFRGSIQKGGLPIKKESSF